MTTALVTGANRGIGLELSRQLQARGIDVIAACRKSSPELDQLGVRVETGADVADDASVLELARRLDGQAIDLLINNAGVLLDETLEALDFAQIRRQFEINSLGPLRVTSCLLPNLARGAKVAIITSRMGSIADNTSGGRYGYRMSKAAVNMAGVSLAHDLRRRGVAVAILHPGFVRTEMTGNQGYVDPEESARGLLQRIDELTLDNSGGFWHANGEQLPW
jgi:NAD(P)-dependent dehydrogenase (short-subunit alcohol dehydrogenase family)